MATSIDCTTHPPQGEARPSIAYLPFPLLSPGERLVADVLPDGQGTLYRSGNIALLAVSGTIASVHIHRVRLTNSDTQDLWRVLAAAAREGAGIFPGEAAHGFIVPPPGGRLGAGPIYDDGAPDPDACPLIIGTRYRCGDAGLVVRHGPTRRGWLNAFGATGLDATRVLHDLPDALALLGVGF